MVLAIRQCVAWASTLITHTHSRQTKNTGKFMIRKSSIKINTPKRNTNIKYISKHLNIRSSLRLTAHQIVFNGTAVIK